MAPAAFPTPIDGSSSATIPLLTPYEMGHFDLSHPIGFGIPPLDIIITASRQLEDVFIPYQWCKKKCVSLKVGYSANQLQERTTNKFSLQAVSPVVQGNGASSQSFEDFTVKTSYTDEDYKLKITAEVSGTKTQEIFDDVFSKMVAAAQPIPGFRRVKGGKTPNIPKNILLEILGPSNVYGQVIKKVINVIVAEYVAKSLSIVGVGKTSSIKIFGKRRANDIHKKIKIEGCLTVGKDLRVLQSFEDLEAQFEPGDIFRFDAVVSVSRLKNEQQPLES